MRIVWTIAVLFAWPGLVWLDLPCARAQSLDPLVVDPQHYSVDVENQWVRVIRERMGPRGKMPMHQHPLPGAVIVFLTDRHNVLTSQDGVRKELRDHAGDLMWSPASTHRSENLDNTPFEAVQIEPRRPAGAAAAGSAPVEKQDATVIDPKHYHVELENEYVRVIRVSIGPHEKLMMHTHPAMGAVLVHLTDQKIRIRLADGTTRDSNYSAKQVNWVDLVSAHQDENLGDATAKFIRVELKLAVLAH
jgi:hypothetical protein